MLAAFINLAGKVSDYRNVAEVKEIDFSTYTGGVNFVAGTVVDGVTFNNAGHFHQNDSYTSGTTKGWLLHFWSGKASLDLNRNELADLFNVNDVSTLDTLIQLNGGAGTDTLKLTGSGQVIDFTKLASKISSIEVIDITGSGDNTLNLSLGNILANGQTDLFHSGDNIQLMVKGNLGDVVNLTDIMPNQADPGDWYQVSNVTITGTMYQVWQHSGINSELLVENGVTVNLFNN